jgi:hypothetical protein
MGKELSSLQIVARVRGVFARHWMDLGLITIMFSRGTVRLQGRLEKLQHAGEPVDEMLLSVMEQEIKRVKNVKRVVFNFENWVRTSAGWEKVRERKVAAASAAGSAVYTVEEGEEEMEAAGEDIREALEGNRDRRDRAADGDEAAARP